MNNGIYINCFDEYASSKISTKITSMCDNIPVICCIGSDLVVGDCLGPIVGSILQSRNIKAIIYGSLKNSMTAKEVKKLEKHLILTHKTNNIITIDASVGNENEIGYIKVSNDGIKPGLGLNKNLPRIGNKSIVGIVANRKLKSKDMLLSVRLSLVYKMASVIADSLCESIPLINNNNIQNVNIIS